MNYLEIIGAITIFTLVARPTKNKLYRKYFPKKYNEFNCPNDHDAPTRYGSTGKCDKCGMQYNKPHVFFDDDFDIQKKIIKKHMCPNLQTACDDCKSKFNSWLCEDERWVEILKDKK